MSKFLKTVYGANRASEYFAPWANLITKTDLKLGDLVGIDTDGKLIKANQTVPPVGVVTWDNVMDIDKGFVFSGERDEEAKLKAGSALDLYKQFLVSGCEVEGDLKIGAPVYLTGEANSEKLTVNKPATGYLVGVVERVTDKLVRFDLTLAVIAVAP